MVHRGNLRVHVAFGTKRSESVNETEALTTFLKLALARRVDRYVEFASKPKTQKKFLDSLHHDLEGSLDPQAAVSSLPAVALDLAAYLYAPPGDFGTPIPSLRDIAESDDESCLAVSRNGRAAVYCPEAYVDSRMCFFWP
jgi:hypothetical protein